MELKTEVRERTIPTEKLHLGVREQKSLDSPFTKAARHINTQVFQTNCRGRAEEEIPVWPWRVHNLQFVLVRKERRYNCIRELPATKRLTRFARIRGSDPCRCLLKRFGSACISFTLECTVIA
jgi:hypothetical protein